MKKLIKGLIILAGCIIILQIVIFVSQMLSGRSTIEEYRASILQSVNNDTATLHEFSQTTAFRRIPLTQSRDSLDLFFAIWHNIPRKPPIVPVK